MARRKIKEHNIRNLQKTSGGSTYMITLPIDLIEELGWRKGQKLTVEKYGEGIIIKDWRSRND